MDATVILKPGSVSREVEVAPGVVNTDYRDVESFLVELGKRTPLETGILPPGTLSIRQAGDHLQLVHQAPPGVNLVNWGAYERDKNAKTYGLAQPYRIAIGDFVGGNLLGCRMFYSPTPVTSLDQPLYHQNVPNINCKGYGETGVGWVCLYHHEQWSHMDIAEKTRRMAERCSGVETYNDRNMSATDGTRFYQAASKPAFLTSPTAWEKKSDKEGFEWTLDESLWIPVLVKNQDNQDKHYDDGVPLTLRMAMEGDAAAYYRDRYWPKPINSIARKDKKVDTGDLYTKIINGAYVASKLSSKPAEKPAPVAKPAVTAIKQESVLTVQKKVPVAKKPALKKPPVITHTCHVCAQPIAGEAAHAVTVPALGAIIYLCTEHVEVMTICCHCGKLHQMEDTMTTMEGLDICLTCAEVSQCQNCGKVFNWGSLPKLCNDCQPVATAATAAF